MTQETIIAASLMAIDRKAISQSIEALVGLLDLIDGDPDLEAVGDERDSAWSEGANDRRKSWSANEDDEDDDPREDDGFDCEHDGREPDDGY